MANRLIEWPPGSGRQATYDDAEFALLRDLQQRCERGEITQDQLGLEIGHLHDAKVELAARIATYTADQVSILRGVESTTGLKTPGVIRGVEGGGPRRSGEELDSDASPENASSEGAPLSAGGWHSLAERWGELTRIADALDERSARADNTRQWNDRFNFLGLLGEHVYSMESGLPWDPKLKLTADRLADGGEDFPGVDVKATPHWQRPRLLRLTTDPLKAPSYALVAIHLDARLGRYVGWATREMIANAPHAEYGHGPTRTLAEGALRGGLPPRGRHDEAQ